MENPSGVAPTGAMSRQSQPNYMVELPDGRLVIRSAPSLVAQLHTLSLTIQDRAILTRMKNFSTELHSPSSRQTPLTGTAA